MDHLVLDIEMCKVPRDCRNKNYKHAMETIQIGVVLLDDEFKQISTLTQYVHPEYGVIDPFIEELTGITNSHVKNAPGIGEALQHLVDWLGNREYTVYAWSNTDFYQLRYEIKAKNIFDDKITEFMDSERWVDYQDVFVKRYDFDRAISLEEALERAEINASGKFHDGLDDAINTGKLIEKLELDKDYELKGYEVPGVSKNMLSYSLGDLLTGLKLQTA